MTALEQLAAAIEAGNVGQFRNLDSDFGKGNGIHAKRVHNEIQISQRLKDDH
jgi:hypothetical protein